MRVAIYTRVSTDAQTTENQLRELTYAIEIRGWKVVKHYTDPGISGAKGRSQRPALDEMLKASVRREFDVVAAWSVDRLGRSLADLVEILAELHTAKIGLYLHQQAIDTTTPAGKAMFQMCGVFAEFERSIISERVRSGLSRARAAGKKLGKPFSISDDVRAEVRAWLAQGKTLREVAALTGVSHATVGRIKNEGKAQ